MKKIVLMLAVLLVLSGYALANEQTIGPMHNLKGCWVMDYIVANSGGGPQLGTPPATPPPWYYQPARKVTGFSYVEITHQKGNKISGTYHNWFGGPPATSPGFYSCLFEGSAIGNHFSLYTASEPAPYGNNTEELRFLQGFITRDSAGKVIYGSGTVARDMDVSTNFNYAVFHYNFVMRPYSEDTCPGPAPGPTQQGPTACPWNGCVLPPLPPP